MSTQKSYKTFWDDKASTTKGALLAVDGSANEQVLQLTGAYSARQVETALIGAKHGVERIFAPLVEAAMLGFMMRAQEARSHHRRQGQ